MQVVPTQVVCPKPTDAQIQAQIENMHWQEKQAEQSNQWQHQSQLHEQEVQEHRAAVSHQEYMVDHLTVPCAFVSVALIASVLLARWIVSYTAADVQKNRDNNDADVRYAQRLIDKHEEAE